MLQDNPLLAQLKQQLHAQTPRVEGTVKATDKSYGFLETDNQKSYFIPPPQMKKVMHGDKIIAALRSDKDREFAEPEQLTEPFLSRFIGRISTNNRTSGKLSILCDHPMLKEPIPCRPGRELQHSCNNGDWVVAQMLSHPLKDKRHFFAEIRQFISDADDHFAPWWVTLARHQLEREAPESADITLTDEPAAAGRVSGGNVSNDAISYNDINVNDDFIDLVSVSGTPVSDNTAHNNPLRQDLTTLPFITIDSASTEDMDDALYIRENETGQLQLTVAIADPTVWIAPDSPLDNIAKIRQFTTYLPGFNIPMLPRALAENLCSLLPGKPRPVLACRVTFNNDGSPLDTGEFFLATIQSQGKLVYDQVSDWLENIAGWQPASEQIGEQLRLLQRLCQQRIQWRQQHALVYKDRPDYRFILDQRGDVQDIVIEQRRIANRIVEEAMIAVNICAAGQLRDRIGFGIFNSHDGFDPADITELLALLNANGISSSAEQLNTLTGFRQLHQQLDSLSSPWLENRIRRFQSFASVSTSPRPHFGLGLDIYATWTSPLRKYGDMINHRLLKSLISGDTPVCPPQTLLPQMAERRKLTRMADRDVSDWLYSRFLAAKMAAQSSAETLRYRAEIIDVSRGGIRVRLLDIGAVAFIPASFLHPVRDEIICNQDSGRVQIKGQTCYQVTDTLDVTIAEIRQETRSVIARPLS